MTAPTQSVPDMSARLARHFVRRLRREAERRAVDAAVEAGFLREEYVDSGGRVLRIFHRGEDLSDTASGPQVAAMLARQRRRLDGESSHPVLGNGDLFGEDDGSRPPSSASATKNAVEPASPGGPASATEIVRAVRAAAGPPKASEVACLLLVAQALGNSEHAEREALDILRRQPIVAIRCGTRHFETCFLDLLGRGLILPGEVTRCNGYDIDRRRSFYFPNMPAAKWQIVCFAGKDRDIDGEGWRVGQAAQASYPILVVSERDRQVPARLAAAAQIKLDCGELNAAMVKRTIEVVLGEQPTEELDEVDFGKLDLADLSIAIRPGATPSSAAATLRILAADPEGEPLDDNESGDSAKSRDSNSTSSGSGSSGRRGKDHVSGSEIVQPKDISGTNSDRFIERIETFSGCDEARDWALSLKEDLPLWQAGDLHWDEMSTKLLLSGPPGTGKTMFARSLCNSLQIPMFITSIATWLEPAYLGDVVKRIKRSFAEAVAHHPAILFIDEIDGIGRRTDFTRDYADYWNALVNCVLELLDGAARTTGVIVVGATNHPAIIDPALLRSGRLSPHLKISPPDVAARMGILRHHLGGDLDTIIATAPKPMALASEDELRSFLHTLPDSVLRDLAANGIEGITRKGTP